MFVAYCIMYTVHCTRIQYRKTASFCCFYCRLHLCISLMHQKALVPASLLLPWLLNFTFFICRFLMRLYVDCTTLASILLLFTVRCPVHGYDVLEQQTPYVKLYLEEVVYHVYVYFEGRGEIPLYTFICI